MNKNDPILELAKEFKKLAKHHVPYGSIARKYGITRMQVTEILNYARRKKKPPYIANPFVKRS